MKNKKLNIKKSGLRKQDIFTIIASALLVFAHIAILVIIMQSWRYYAIYPSLFGSIVAIVICLMIIIDIVFFVGFNHHDMFLKIISTTLAVLLLAGGTVGVYFLNKANTIVDGVLDDGKDKYETFSGTFVCYDKYNKFSALSDLSGKRVGMLAETSNGLTYIATNILSKEKIDYATVDYKTSAELIQALIDSDVDAIVVTSGYRGMYAAKEGQPEEEISPFSKYLDNFIDFYSFDEELKVDSNKTTKNLSKDPFNVLLIGYSRTDIGSSVGLADSIILATINPQTYTVSMMSIARDSFVPIPCYGGELDKINSGRSTSRACFIETVENFIGIDIDYYMELDYLGLVQIVNTIGGVRINNPVDFTLDGIYVPAGSYVADGQQALQFCRERHHMPNGDFDRQQHQKEVIIAIAKKFVQSGDVTLALNAMKAASNWMSTDMTLNQLTSVFNLLLNTKNYTDLSTFDLIDFHTLRITGYGGILYYSMSMRLPLWVYLIYQGSYDESITHIKEVMGEYTKVSQEKAFEFSSLYPYSRPLFYSLDYDKKFCYEPDPMPPYWASLEGMTLEDASSWAKANGVTLSISYINPGDAKYDRAYEGLVVEQSPRYGALVSEYKTGSIVVMAKAELDESKQVPNFVGDDYSRAVKWARNYGVPYSIDFNTSVSGSVGKVVSQSPEPYTPIGNVEKLRIVVKAGQFKVHFDKNNHGGTAPDDISVTTGDDSISLTSGKYVMSDNNYTFLGWYTSATDGTKVTSTSDISAGDGGTVTLYAHWDHNCKDSDLTIVETVNATCTTDGSETLKCKVCGKVKTNIIPATHKYEGTIIQNQTCGDDEITRFTCSVCGNTYEEVTKYATEQHSWGEWTSNGSVETRTCSVCKKTETRTPPEPEPEPQNPENTDS